MQKKLLLLVLIALFAAPAQSQIKMEVDGDVLLGQHWGQTA